LENGRRPINDLELAALAKALKVPVQRLFDEAKEKAGDTRHQTR
jgi:hypothetical protein